MFKRLAQYVHDFFTLIFTASLMLVGAFGAMAAPYADLVMDARTGEVLHATNADTRLHPASLTKMMTLYIVFEAIERGEISLDTKVKISAHAAAEPKSKLGLKAGQSIAVRYLIRAAAVKSANDCATALGEAIEGSEAAFARRMNRTAKALGMTRSTFKNANGLTEAGHLSTARDMSLMGRRLFYDFPAYYSLFSRRTVDTSMGQVANTNSRLLENYDGADGIKTGFTLDAGYNLVASAERGQTRIIATVFGGRSTATRNARVAELLDIGFAQAPSRAQVKRLPKPVYAPDDFGDVLAGEDGGTGSGIASAKTIRVVMAPLTSPRPRPRPPLTGEVPPDAVLLALQDNINSVLAEVQSGNAGTQPDVTADAMALLAPADGAADDAADDAAVDAGGGPDDAGMSSLATDLAVALAAADAGNATGLADGPASDADSPVTRALTGIAPPPPRPMIVEDAVQGDGQAGTRLAGTSLAGTSAAEISADDASGQIADARVIPEPGSRDASAEAANDAQAVAAGIFAALAPSGADASGAPENTATTAYAFAGTPSSAPVVRPRVTPQPRPAGLAHAPSDPAGAGVQIAAADVGQEIVSRVSSSNARHWVVNIGRYPSRFDAEGALLRTALSEIGTLDAALQRVVPKGGGFDANFVGLSAETADMACRRLTARALECTAFSG